MAKERGGWLSCMPISQIKCKHASSKHIMEQLCAKIFYNCKWQHNNKLVSHFLLQKANLYTARGESASARPRATCPRAVVRLSRRLAGQRHRGIVCVSGRPTGIELTDLGGWAGVGGVIEAWREHDVRTVLCTADKSLPTHNSVTSAALPVTRLHAPVSLMRLRASL